MNIEILRFVHVLCNYMWMGSFILIGGYLALRRGELSLQEANTKNRLYYKFELPGLIGSVISGLLLIYFSPSVDLRAGWFHLKLTSVFLLLLVDLFWFRVKLSTAHLFGQNAKGIFLPRVLGATFFVLILASIYILKPLMNGTPI